MMMKNRIINFVKAVLIICLAVLILSIIILSLVPPVSRDALTHHLAVPKLYINHGAIYEIPFMNFSYYPMNLELLYLVPLYFGNDIAPKFIHFAFALLTSWLIFYYLRKRANAPFGLLGAIFFLSIPVIVKLSITVYVDLGEIFFSFASLLFILKWLKSGFRLRYLIYAGIICGLALGTKYNGLVTLAILTLFVPFIYSRYGEKKGRGVIQPVRQCMMFIIISLLVFSPWMIRNYHWKSNPVYPLYNGLFNPKKDISTQATSGDNNEETVKMNRGIFTYRSMIYNETGLEIALLPIRIFFQGQDNDPQYFDGRLNPFMLILPFFAFYGLKDDPEYLRREKKILLAFSILYFSFAFFTYDLRARYISPIIPPLILLSVFGLINLYRMANQISSIIFRRISVALVVIVMCIAIALNADYIRGQFKYVDPIPFITGKVSRDEYIGRYIPEYPAVRYINTNLDNRAKVLSIYIGKRGYYYDREYSNDIGILQRSISRAERPEDILGELKKNRITHLLIRYGLFEEWMNNNFSKGKQELTQQFFREHTNLLFIENGFGVLAFRQNIQ
jgi:4-amino-4-deoxy-L-arabinose transferase-like glycosyltransferase